MSETATAPVATVTLPSGAVVTSAMTPLERHNAVAASLNLPTAAKPAGLTFGPGGLTPATANRLAAGEREQGATAAPGTIAGKAPPPPPAALEAANKPANVAPYDPAKVAAYDAEMRAAGKQLPLATPATDAPPKIDQTYLTKLNASYTQLMGDLERLPPSPAKDRNVAKIRSEYDAELRDVYEGRRLGEKRSAFRARRDGTAVAPAPVAAPAKPGWQSHIEDGQWVGLENLTVHDTHGYTIPRFVDGQRLHVSTFELLKQAKAAGISQAQVNAVLTQQARNHGWVKS